LYRKPAARITVPARAGSEEVSMMNVAIEPLFREVSLRRSEEVAPLVRGVASELAALGYSPRDCMGLVLVLKEAVVNGLRHGNGGDPAKQVRVRFRIAFGEVLIDVEDEGSGFNPHLVPDPTLAENLDRPSGRGLFSMRSYTTWMNHSGGGRRVTLFKRRSG
jgi:serine/threonine-protein kinase RsbW